MQGLGKGTTTTQHPPSPASRAGADTPTNIKAVSRAVRYVNTRRPRFQVRARPSYIYMCIYIERTLHPAIGWTHATRYIRGSSPQAPNATLGSVPSSCVLESPFVYTVDREDASSKLTAGGTANTTEGNSRASRGSGSLCSHSQTVHNTKGTRAHTHRELIRTWRWEPKGSSLEYI